MLAGTQEALILGRQCLCACKDLGLVVSVPVISEAHTGESWDLLAYERPGLQNSNNNKTCGGWHRLSRYRHWAHSLGTQVPSAQLTHSVVL